MTQPPLAIGGVIEFVISAPPKFSGPEQMKRVGTQMTAKIVAIDDTTMTIMTLSCDGRTLEVDEQQLLTLQYTKEITDN